MAWLLSIMKYYNVQVITQGDWKLRRNARSRRADAPVADLKFGHYTSRTRTKVCCDGKLNALTGQERPAHKPDPD